MRVTTEKWMTISHRLRHLVEFLNFNFEKLPFFTREERQVFWSASVASENPKAAEQVQIRLRQTLIPLTNPKKRPSLEQVQRLIAGLIRKADKMQFRGTWTPPFYRLEYDSSLNRPVFLGRMPGFARGRIIRLKGENAWGKTSLPIKKEEVMWIPVSTAAGETQKVGWYIKSSISSEKIEERIYYEVLRLLEDGELALLKSCPECQRFFVEIDPRRDFCNDTCRHAFNNKQRLKKPGDGPNYFTRLRHEKRKLKITRARSLLKEGKSPIAVSKEVKLSLRVLRKEGVFR